MPAPPWLKHRAERRKKYSYIPVPTSGGWSILVGMYQAEQKEFIKNMTKNQLLDYCIKYSKAAQKDNSKTFASMKGLLDRSLIARQVSRDPVYWLTDEGKDLAKKLLDIAEGKVDETNQPDEESADTQYSLISSQNSTSNLGYTLNERDGNFKLIADTYDIILIIDQREKIQIRSLDNSMIMETRTLACGDFLWIARPKNIADGDKTKDLVLDYVVERKRFDDLASSMIDGRFEQQKQRLLNCGVRRPMFLFEEIKTSSHCPITPASLNQKIVNTLIDCGIDVEKVKNAGDFNDYLVSMTKCIKKFYSNKDLFSCTQDRLVNGEANENEFMTFSDFQTKGAKIKNWTVKEMFAKHLIQITGMSEKRVAVIIEKYPTMTSLIEAYNKCNNEKEKQELLAKLPIPDSNRAIGKVLSNRVYACYGMPPNHQFDVDDFND